MFKRIFIVFFVSFGLIAPAHAVGTDNLARAHPMELSGLIRSFGEFLSNHDLFNFATAKINKTLPESLKPIIKTRSQEGLQNLSISASH